VNEGGRFGIFLPSFWDRKFGIGKDVSEFLDLSKAQRPTQEQRRVNVDFPEWVIDSLAFARMPCSLLRR
jgi:hypothetical protein